MEETIPIRGLHHVTATVGQAQHDLDFYAGALGLRLIKKTVNFDNHNVYHFYYGNESGAPGTLMTTFPYEGWGVSPGTRGPGQIIATALSVPAGTLGFWEARLEELGISRSRDGERFGEQWMAFSDPSGLVIELIANPSDERPPWVAEGATHDVAVRGLYGITMAVRDPASSLHFLKEVLGWEVLSEAGARTRLAVNGDAPGQIIEVLHAPEMPPAVNGLGTVHHVAMAVDDEDVQLAARERLVQLGIGVTEVRDRQYFKSIYFREPGGVLYEIVTAGPGFLVDEELQDLGQGLRLPPWEEPSRVEIEGNLGFVQH